MKILVHDYAGHPFQVRLSAELARRGHDVTHVYFADNPGPKGAFERTAGERDQLRFIGVTFGGAVDPGSLIGRRSNDIRYGKRVSGIIKELNPHVVISGNTPTEAQTAILGACRKTQTRFVYWLQDVYSVAVSILLKRRLGFFGSVVGWYYEQLDRRQFRKSDAIVAITEDFKSLASSWSGSAGKVSVIENWGSLDGISVGSKDNAWSREHDLNRGFNFLYSGTLGLKHKPELLLRLARDCAADTRVAMVGQGAGVKTLEAAAGTSAPVALKLLPIQPASRLSEVLATADVLVAVIEKEAGTFAVPSKVQSYMCAGRPILLAAPKENLAARVVMREEAGIVVDPDDEDAFVAAAARLQADPELRARLGANGRAYAEKTYDIQSITDRFEGVLRGPVQRREQPERQPQEALNLP